MCLQPTIQILTQGMIHSIPSHLMIGPNKLQQYLIHHLPNPNWPEPVPSGPIPSSRSTGYLPAVIELMGFKKGIKREIAAYPSLKDERYFDGFKRSLLIVAKTHECNEVLDPNYTPGIEPPTWGKPLSEDTWPILMLNQSGKSSVSMSKSK